MIQPFIDKFMAAREHIEADLRQKHPENYDALVRRVVEILGESEYPWPFERPDPERVTIIDHGDYQGTRLYVIGAKGYQPSTYWSILVNYGSCSGCDAFESIRRYAHFSGDAPSAEQVKDYWTLMLHMVQSMRRLDDSGKNWVSS